MKKLFYFMGAVLTAIGMSATISYADNLAIDIESGIVTAGYNDIRIPGDFGTEISFSRELSVDPVFYYRARLIWELSEKHQLQILAAPLRLEAEGRVSRAVRFQDEIFAAGVLLKGRYRFDSYRLTYRYNLYRAPHLRLGIGFTGKIRDAAISLEDGTTRTEKTNVGFVPLINFGLWWGFDKKWGIQIDGDALAAPQGRAEDVMVSLVHDLSDKIMFRAGYRLLEGGADNDEVYTFALMNYFGAGVTVKFL